MFSKQRVVFVSWRQRFFFNTAMAKLLILACLGTCVPLGVENFTILYTADKGLSTCGLALFIFCFFTNIQLAWSCKSSNMLMLQQCRVLYTNVKRDMRCTNCGSYNGVNVVDRTIKESEPNDLNLYLLASRQGTRVMIDSDFGKQPRQFWAAKFSGTVAGAFGFEELVSQMSKHFCIVSASWLASVHTSNSGGEHADQPGRCQTA